VNDLRDQNGDRYYVEQAGGEADIVLAECPICSFPEYLRTTADQNIAASLFEMPRV